MRLWRLLTKAWRARPRIRARGLRELTIESHVARLGRVAKREEIPIGELEDALSHIAGEYPVTVLEVLDVVEDCGLSGAHRRLQELDRDQ